MRILDRIKGNVAHRVRPIVREEYTKERIAPFVLLTPKKQRTPVFDSDHVPYFVYELLFPDGDRYKQQTFVEYAMDPNATYCGKGNAILVTPALPTYVRDGWVEKLAEQGQFPLPDSDAINKRLRNLRREHGFVERKVGSFPLFGTDLERLCNLVFVPGTRQEHADENIRDYAKAVAAVLAPVQLTKEYTQSVFKAVADQRYTPKDFFFRGRRDGSAESHPFSRME